MKKKLGVVMLPTEKESKLLLSQIDGLVYTDRVNSNGNNLYKPQHLYLTSDDEIKEGDRYYIEGADDICYANGDRPDSEGRKIIATTDKSLSINKHISLDLDLPSIPRIPSSFIKEFVKADGKITEVEADMIECTTALGAMNGEWVKKPKLTDSNEVIISPVERLNLIVNRYYNYEGIEEKMYSRDEVKELMYKALIRGTNCDSQQEGEQWIEDNL
jgi:hypothetical protein